MSLLELRQALHAVLGFRSDVPTATPDQIIAAVRDAITRADDAEQDLAKVHEALDAAGVPATHGGLVIEAGLAIGAVDRVRVLVDEREEARDTIDAVHHALDDAKVRSVSDSGGLLATDRIGLLAEERNEYRAEVTTLLAELDAYRSRGLPPVEAPKPATRDTAALRELLNGLEADAVRAHHPVSAASVRAVRVLVGVSDA